VRGHCLDLGPQDPTCLCLDLLFCDLRHAGGVPREARPRQTYLSFQKDCLLLVRPPGWQWHTELKFWKPLPSLCEAGAVVLFARGGCYWQMR
jgi:hypothetical protein